MHVLTSAGCSAAKALLAAIGVALSGCAIGESPLEASQAGLSCVDDTPHCVSQRQATLKSMVADKERGWLKEPATPAAYASGVRLFAYKSTKKDLSCAELDQGRKEADGAPAALKVAGQFLTPAQVSRGVMFAGEVGRELGNEIKRRCKKG